MADQGDIRGESGHKDQRQLFIAACGNLSLCRRSPVLTATDTNFIHVIFGAGKFEDIPISDTTHDDMRDIARTSVYNLKDLVQPPKTNFFSANAQTVGNFKIELNPRCPDGQTPLAHQRTQFAIGRNPVTTRVFG